MRTRAIIFRTNHQEINEEKVGCKDSQAPILQLSKVWKVGGGGGINFDNFQEKVVFFKRNKDYMKKSHPEPENLWLLGVSVYH